MGNNVDKLTNACQCGDIPAAESLLSKGTSVNSSNTNGFPPLYCAAQDGQTAVVELLLQRHGADVDVTGPQGNTALYIAAAQGHSQVVEALLHHQASVNQATTTDGVTPLYIASEKGHRETVELLLKNQASVNQTETTDGATPLYIASQNGHREIVELLLQNQASVNQATTTDGVTPLYIASEKGHREIVELLLQNQASVNQARDTGPTPLCIAAKNGHLSVVTVLLAHGASVHQAGAYGTPLDIARQQGHTAVVELLIQHQASENEKTIPDGEKDNKGNINSGEVNTVKQKIKALFSKGNSASRKPVVQEDIQKGKEKVTQKKVHGNKLGNEENQVQGQELIVKQKKAGDSKRDNLNKKAPLHLQEKTKQEKDKATRRSKVSNTEQNEGEEKKGSIIDFSQVRKEVLDIAVKKVAELKLPPKYRTLDEMFADINNEGKEMAGATAGRGLEMEADKDLSNKHLLKIATKIGPKWTLFAGFLNIGLRQVKEIQREHRDDHTMAAWEMLSLWAELTQGQTLEVRRQQLRDAAGEIDRQDLWQLI